MIVKESSLGRPIQRTAVRMRVHESKKHHLRVRVSRLESSRILVQIALGSDVRTLSLNEFTTLWLDMVEISREATTAQLNFLLEPLANNKRKSLQRWSATRNKSLTQSYCVM
jgi:hypothetical protein